MGITQPSKISSIGPEVKSSLPHVALLIDASGSFGRNVMRGVNDYARAVGGWLFHLPAQTFNHRVPLPEEWSGDGIIAHPRREETFIQQLKKVAIPVVTVSGKSDAINVPSVGVNPHAIAELAMTHFRERGFVRFAYCWAQTQSRLPPIGRRFVELAYQSNFPCEVFVTGSDFNHRTLEPSQLVSWVNSLPKPIGLLAANDARAREVLDACLLAGVRVPDEIAVLGISDDELICELANPPLSSISHNARKIGFEAAHMLDTMMSGRPAPADIQLDPLNVHTRGSTDLVAIEEPDIAGAVRYIREHACDGIHVNDVVQEIAMSRRAFERRFRLIIGRTPHDEIRRVQLERVKQLLASSDYNMQRIAELAGFSSGYYMANLFREMIGTTPGAWRLRAQIRNRRDPISIDLTLDGSASDYAN